MPLWVARDGGSWWRGNIRGPRWDTPPRPEGAGYVRYEDTYIAGDTLQDVIDRVTGDRVLTFPEGEFTFAGFGEGFFEGIRLGHPSWGNGCRGLAGSGRGTIFKMAPGTATQTQRDQGNITGPAGATNPLTLMTVTPLDTDPRSGVELTNFALYGTEQGTFYNGLTVRYCPGVTISDLYLRGASPGWEAFPPGETFGISIYQSDNATLTRTQVDGRHPDTGVPVCSSPFGWNSANNATVTDVYCHDALWGMPTFWNTAGITTTDLWSHRHGSGAAKTNGTGINHENVSGAIRHVRPNLIANSGTGSSGMHMTLNNGAADANDVIITDPVFDPGHREGCFSIMIGDLYVDPFGDPQAQTTMPTVTIGGATLTAGDADVGVAGATPSTVWYRFH